MLCTPGKGLSYMLIARSIAELRQHLYPSQCPAFVPTMGNLHAGHIKLIERARPLGDFTVASIFVNRLQFLPHEDFDSYPRTWEADCAKLKAAGIRVSMFIDPDQAQLDASVAVGAPVVELHTGAYAHAHSEAAVARELARLQTAAAYAARIGLECHAGHGLTFDNVGPVAAIPELVELNIGHFLVGAAVFEGLDAAIGRMRGLMAAARAPRRADG